MLILRQQSMRFALLRSASFVVVSTFFLLATLTESGKDFSLNLVIVLMFTKCLQRQQCLVGLKGGSWDMAWPTRMLAQRSSEMFIHSGTH